MATGCRKERLALDRHRQLTYLGRLAQTATTDGAIVGGPAVSTLQPVYEGTRPP